MGNFNPARGAQVEPGMKYGKLTVIRRNGTWKRYAAWLCQCECGNYKTVQGINLRSGATKSCGCSSHDYQRLHPAGTKHGMHETRLYRIWCNMKARCYNPKKEEYELYGGRGIAVCDEWRNDFKAFADWSLANGYDDKLSIDRIDNNKGYFPDNCRWATAKMQFQNRRPMEEWPSTIRQLEAIHQKCVTCTQDVGECQNESCPLYPYRMGHNPKRKGMGGKLRQELT